MTAWTAPRTWVALETVTASLLNTHVRDNELYLKEQADDLAVIFRNVTTTSNSLAAETSLISGAPTIPALATNGQVARVCAYGTRLAVLKTLTWKVKFAGTLITTFSYTPNATASSWKVLIDIERSGAAEQIITSELVHCEDSSLASVFMQTVVGTASMASPQTIDLTVQVTTGASGDVSHKASWARLG